MTRRAARAYRGAHRSPSMLRAYYGIRARQAAALIERQRATALLDLLAERLGLAPDAAQRHARVLSALLGGAIDAHALSRIRQTTAAARLGLSRSTIQRHARRLIAGGVLIAHRAPREPIEGAGTWITTGPNGYELSPAVLDYLAAVENDNRAAKSEPEPAQPRDYRGVTRDASTLSGSTRAARAAPGAAPPAHDYAEDGYGLCIMCQLPPANRRHAPPARVR